MGNTTKTPLLSLGRKTKVNFKKLDSHLFTTPFREMGEQILGELDTANSFMYLFRRFGAPLYTNEDEYKILYEYRFRYQDLVVCIHASYHQHVYFGVLVPISYRKDFFNKRVAFQRKLAKETLKKDQIPFFGWSILDGSIKELLTETELKKLWDLVDAKGKEFFSAEVYKIFNEHTGEISKELFDKWEPFDELLKKEFFDSLSEDQKKTLHAWWPELETVPELKAQFTGFFEELKRGFYVRDVAINIRGYESDDNVISTWESEEEEEPVSEDTRVGGKEVTHV